MRFCSAGISGCGLDGELVGAIAPTCSVSPGFEQKSTLPSGPFNQFWQKPRVAFIGTDTVRSAGGAIASHGRFWSVRPHCLVDVAGRSVDNGTGSRHAAPRGKGLHMLMERGP
eukprot:3393433-Alexandrium_andersonii.AAC.2